MKDKAHPHISIIIRTCPGRQGCLEMAIRSVEQQTYRPIEVVVVEDGGNEAVEIIERHIGRPGLAITYKSLEKSGRCVAGNVGMEISSGEYLSILDDDDELYPKHCEVLIGCLNSDAEAFAACGLAHEVVTSIESYTPYVYTEYKQYIRFNRVFNRESLWMGNYLPIQSVLFNKSLFLENGGFDVKFDVLEDWDLWVRYSCNHKFISVPEVTSMYRVPREHSKRKSRESSFRENYFHVLEKQDDLRTEVDIESYLTICKEILKRYYSLRLLNKIKAIDFETIYSSESEYFPSIEKEFYEISPREAVRIVQLRLFRNKIIRKSMVYENKTRTLIKRVFDFINR